MPDPRIFPVETVNDTVEAVEDVSTLVLAANSNRVGADFINVTDPSEMISLARGHAAVLGSGDSLTAYGSSYRIGTDNLWKGAVYAISTSGNGLLSISEEEGKG